MPSPDDVYRVYGLNVSSSQTGGGIVVVVTGGGSLETSYFAFTKKASEEARDRFLELRPNLTKKDIKYFQTLHSLAFNNLGLKEENVMDELNYKVIGFINT